MMRYTGPLRFLACASAALCAAGFTANVASAQAGDGFATGFETAIQSGQPSRAEPPLPPPLPRTLTLPSPVAQPLPQPQAPQAPAPSALSVGAPPQVKTETGGPGSSAAETFCKNIADAAAEARHMRQKQELQRLEAELERRLALIEEKTAEYKAWLKRRGEFADKVRESLTGIYARMKPEAAAQHLAAMDEETAAALLLKLNVRQASAILNEMPPQRAARLAMIVSGAGGGLKPEEAPVSQANGGSG